MNFKINKPEDREAVIQYINRLPDKAYDVKIVNRKKKRTLNQNSLYWLWINCISDETGNDPKELHEYFSDKYLPKETIEIFGIAKSRPISTTKLNTVQFTNYMENIEVFASSELGIVLPQPEDLYFTDFLEKYKNYI